ncbi:hypothetical protein C8F01DRAFT_1184899, partial [Mycena amicta]
MCREKPSSRRRRNGESGWWRTLGRGSPHRSRRSLMGRIERSHSRTTGPESMESTALGSYSSTCTGWGCSMRRRSEGTEFRFRPDRGSCRRSRYNQSSSIRSPRRQGALEPLHWQQRQQQRELHEGSRTFSGMKRVRDLREGKRLSLPLLYYACRGVDGLECICQTGIGDVHLCLARQDVGCIRLCPLLH